MSRTRLDALKVELDRAESRLRSLRGKHVNRSGPPLDGLADVTRDLVRDSAELFERVAKDLELPPRKAILDREEKTRNQAIEHFKKSKVDPKVWTDLASS